MEPRDKWGLQMFAKELKKAAALAVMITAAGAATAAAQAPPPPAPVTVVTKWKGAPETSEEDRAFRVNGRIQYDIYSVNADLDNGGVDQDYAGSFVRRAFIGVEGRFTQNWRYNIKFDLSPGQSDTSGQGNEVRLDDAYLEYAGNSYSIFIGQNNAVSHMEDRASSLNTPFNERSSLDQAFGFGKIMGIGWLTNGGNWSLGAELYGDTANNAETVNQDEATALAVRGTFAPIYSKTPDGVTLLHLGLNARQRDNGGGPAGPGSTFSYSARPGVGTGTQFVSASGFAHQDTFLGGEFAFQHNAFGLDGEYGTVNAQPAGAGADREYKAGYLGAYWSPTGESRNYSASDGSFKNVTPFRTMGSDGGIGHVMLSARYDYLDLTDGGSGTNGGKQTGYLAGATWVPITNVKFQLNYAKYKFEYPGASAQDGDADTITMRTQIDW
jgi:phosphate-selective porin OprO and OprP